MQAPIECHFFVDMGSCEIWKKVNGFPDYEISNYGRIKSFKFKKPRILNPSIHNRGYRMTGLSVDNKQHMFLLHRLVACHFVDNPDNKKQVNHIDGDKENNHASNLEWCSLNENISHAIKNKLMGVKLCDSDVRAIRLLYSEGIYDKTRLAELYNVTSVNIYYIVTKKKWKNVI